MDLSISNVINISVSQPGLGIGNYNTSNVALFTREAYASSFGTSGYAIYLDPTQVGVDFGTNSTTFAMANAVFTPAPNILANSGYLVVIPFSLAVQAVQFGATPSTGVYQLDYNGNATTDLAYNALASDVQTALRLLTGLSAVTVSGSYTTSFTVTMTGVTNPLMLTTSHNTTLQTLVIASTENLSAAITRTAGLVQYFGILSAEIEGQTNMLAAAAVVQPLNKIIGFASSTAADVEPAGQLDLLRTGGFNKSRGLFYGGTALQALVYSATYFGRAFSTNFSGSNTTQNMHLKDLPGVQPDPSMTQTLLGKCQAAGVDVYISIQGVAKVFTSGANVFFDRVYNLGWFVGALQVAGFNYLAQTPTKIPQTESGITGLKGAYGDVCAQGVTNRYGAPGVWTSPSTFGNQADFYANVLQVGYYIYSTPIAQQSPSDRSARIAPLVQIAFKEAGAVNSSNVMVNINP